jgi:glycine oxidase
VRSPDVAIIGAGVIGCALARLLAADGTRTLVIDRNPEGDNASWAAAGMLAPLAEADEASDFLRLLQAGSRLFAPLAVELQAEAGIDIAHRTDGTLFVALSAKDEEELGVRYRWQARAGLTVERLGGGEARVLEPALSTSVRSALRFADDHQVDNRLLACALTRSAEAAGAVIRPGEVRGITRARGAVTGVELASGEVVKAPQVVVAAGCWSGQLAGLPRPLPVRPVHGQLLALQADPALLTHVVDSPRVYLVPRKDGRVIVGTTTEETGFERGITAAAVARLRTAATEAVPALADAALLESWSGLRPGTPDGLPILGPDPDLEGLFYATGHYRNGILLAPLTARLLFASLRGSPTEVGIEPFTIARFSDLTH